MTKTCFEFELVLVRHGETEANKSHTIQGHRDTPLSDTGHQQAERVAARLADEQFDLLISSDLQRAHQTAQAVVKVNSSLASDQVEKWVVARARGFGDLEGKSVEEMMESTKGLTKDEIFRWGPPNGETGEAFRERTKRFLQQLCARVLTLETNVRPVVLVCTHGGFIRELNMYLVNSLGCVMPCKNGEYGMNSPNTGVTRFVVTLNEKAEVEEIRCSLLYCKTHLTDMSVSEPVHYKV